MSEEQEILIPDEAPPPYAPPEKPEEPPPAYFPEEYTMAVEGRSHLVPPNMHVSHYVDSGNGNMVIEIRRTPYRQRDFSIPIPPNYTCMAVIATIFFFPVGVFAIVYAIKARDSITAGNIVEGWKYARTARILSRLAFVLWTLLFSSLIIIIIISANT